MTVQTVINFDAPRRERRPQTPYWNTTPLTRDQLADAIRAAEHQDEAVMAIYRAAGRPLAPSQVWEQGTAMGLRWLLTSVRRSITNLTTAGALVRLQMTRQGPYGRQETCWALPDDWRAAA